MRVPNSGDSSRDTSTASFGRRAPYTLAPDWVALSGVSNNAKVLFWHIAMHVNNARGDHSAWPGRPVLARRMGYSRADKVDRYIRELIDLGAIECFERERENGGQASNHYVVHETPPPGYTGPASIADAYAQEKTGSDQGASKISPGQTPVPARGRGGPSNGDGGGPPRGDGGGPSNGGPNKKNNNHTKNNHPSVRSVRSAQRGDARAHATAPQAANEDPKGSDSSEISSVRPSGRPQSTEGAPNGQPDAPAADRPSGRRSASQDARRVLGALPRVFRDGAAPWVLASLAVRIDVMLADGHQPGAIVGAAEEIAVARPVGDRDHIAALRAVRAALRANAFDRQAADVADRCDGCGARRTGALPCTTCDPVEVLDVIALGDDPAFTT